MALLNADEAVIVLLDMQSSVFSVLPEEVRKRLAHNLNGTMAIAQAFGLPVILSTMLENGPQGGVLDVLEKAAPGVVAARIQRNGIFDAFTDHAFADAVASTGRNTILLGGLDLAMSVSHTAMSARDRGLNVRVLVNCSGSPTPLGGELALRRLEAMGILPTTSMTCFGEMARGLSTELGGRMMQVIVDKMVLSGDGPID